MSEYEARRLQNIKRNQALVEELGLEHNGLRPANAKPRSKDKKPPAKRRKLHVPQPTRASARIASGGTRPSYNEDELERAAAPKTRQPKSPSPAESAKPSAPRFDLETLRDGWTSWKPEASEPFRDSTGTFHFLSHPDFTPNKSPEEIIREGSFGGSYWRPLYSKALGTTIQDDWKELPAGWTKGLDVKRYLKSPSYNAEVNKYGVACGQSIEEWEASGWIMHEYDVRGWFQWYCRFWMGRRCPDDERQISRWKKCVGETGRWRRILLKKYVQMGIKTVFDDGEDDDSAGDVSPVVHQTCHHWAYEVRQDALDRFWATGK
ncbi:hypothetical protein IWX90DRAFT_249926 [Phyllosticta citrichinensis]|uniref:Vegetatible incompatibility protein HET-E-1 n=1 Tax=Phyllosticta citrichinensis TaxID=1130410 RepID=A0ABR1XR49_9PEZI